MNRTRQFLWPAALLVLAGFTAARGAPVTEAEAVAVADVWYAMELNSRHVVFDSAERAERMWLLLDRSVSYQVSTDTVLDSRPQDRTILAYIVKYKPHGLVVVPGDDRINAVMVFSTGDDFRWDQPERNFLRYYLATEVPARWQSMQGPAHGSWTYLRSKLSEPISSVRFEMDTDYPVLWSTAHWDQSPYYNDTVIAHNGNTSGIPAGCVATAEAIKMRFHSRPWTGTEAHAYYDNEGDIRYYHSVNFATTYNWAAMPMENLSGPNADIARLMYHCGVSVEMNYESLASGASTGAIANALNTYFHYKGTENIHSDTYSHHAAGIKQSVLARAPVNVGGWGHSVVIDGYREPTTPYYHVNAGWGGYGDDWYHLDSMPPHDTGVVSVSCPYGVPANWFYVDAGYSGSENGTIQTPYNTLSEGQSAVPSGGWLLVKEGLYTGSGNVPITFQTAKAMVSYNAGTANVGHKLTLTRYGRIDLVGNGQLKIY